MQINLNCFQEKYTKPLSKYHIREDDTNQIYVNNLVIYELNIVKCSEVYYNEDKLKVPNYIRWGTLILCEDYEEIPEITKGIMTYEERNLIMDKIKKLTSEDLFMTEEEALEWAEWEKNTIYKDGKQEATIDMIKKMLQNNADIEFISKVTGKTIEEITKMQKNN